MTDNFRTTIRTDDITGTLAYRQCLLVLRKQRLYLRRVGKQLQRNVTGHLDSATRTTDPESRNASLTGNFCTAIRTGDITDTPTYRCCLLVLTKRRKGLLRKLGLLTLSRNTTCPRRTFPHHWYFAIRTTYRISRNAPLMRRRCSATWAHKVSYRPHSKRSGNRLDGGLLGSVIKEAGVHIDTYHRRRNASNNVLV